jgi:subtilisin-like proprotein convertase family protein
MNRKPHLRPSKRRHLKCEMLEARRLLAADLIGQESLRADSPITEPVLSVERVAQIPSHEFSYEASGREIGLSLHPRRLAIATPDTSQFGWGQLPGDLELVRSLDNGISVFESQSLSSSELERALTLFPGVEKTSPVFLNGETKSEMALLDQVVVQLNEGFTTEDLLAEFPAIESIEPMLGTPDQLIVTLGDSIGPETLEWNSILDASDLVERSVPNFYQDWQRFYTPDDARFENLWHLHNTGQFGATPGADSSLVEAWDVQQGGSADIVIGVFDDGVVNDHPDLNIWENPAEAAGDPFTDNDGNGWLNDINGWNFVNDNAQTAPTAAGDNHGTAVAGVAAAIGDNGIGVAGASYGSPVMVGRLFDGNSGVTDAEIATGFYYFAGRTADGTGTWDSADIVNNSWGGGAPSTLIEDSLVYATTQGRGGTGMPILFASGNGFAPFVSYPANLSETIPGVISVGAHNSAGERSDYSSHGTALDIVTPSNNFAAGFLAIDTTDRVGTAGYANDDYTGTGATGFGGTSSASPLAAGITALLLARAESLGLTLTAPEVRDLIRANTDLIGSEADYEAQSGKDFEYGYGRLNAGMLLGALGTPEISVTSNTGDLESGVSEANFGGVVLGESSQLVFRIRNQGTEELSLAEITITGDGYTIDTSSTSMSLGLGEATTVAVISTPTSSGTKSGTLSISSNDSDEPVFEFDIVTEVLVPTISGVLFEDGDADDNQHAAEAGIPDAVAFIDGNASGSFDTFENTFENTTQTDIPDNGSTTSTLEVSGVVGDIFDLNVGLNITHTWNPDLVASLIAPDGTRVELFANVGAPFVGNFTDTVLDDSAELSINEGSTPFTGSFRPEEPLSTFQGNPNGTWTFEIADNFSFDVGTLDSWSLHFVTTEEIATTPNAAGEYRFLNLPEGTYEVRATHEGWTSVSPSGGSRSYTVSSPEDTFEGGNFGLAKNDRFYSHVFEDTNGNGEVDEGEAALPDWTVFLDVNEDGEYDPPTETSIVNETDVPITDGATASSIISAAGVDGIVVDVDVRLEITHTFAADLDVSLVAPDGTTIVLFDDVGGSGDDFTGTILDDEADTDITAGTAPFTGSFRPENPLSGFDGLLAGGDWTLEVFDDAGGDTGTLLEWELILEVATEPLANTNEGGFMAMDLGAGTHKMQLLAPEGWEFTVPADGILEATTDGTPITSQLFGARPIDDGTDITEDTVWDDTENPYQLTGDVRVRNGATLTILDGVTVETSNPDFELQIGTDTETGTLDVGEASFGVGLIVQPGSTANLDETSLTGNMVDILGTLWASETVFDTDLNTNPDSEVNIRFSDFAPNQIFVFDSRASVMNVTHNDFALASPDSVQAFGPSTDTIDLSRNWWGTSDSATIGSFILDRLDDGSRPLIEFVEPLTVLYVLGDANGDGALTNIDIGAFLLALTNRNSYTATYPEVDPDVVLDMNWNGSLGNTDIGGFINKLTGG